MIRFAPANAQHVGSRSNQQDSFGFSDLGDARFIEHGGFVAIVADGMGGLAHGDAASRLAVKAFLETYAGKMPGEPIPDALSRSLLAANNAVFGHAVSVGSPGDVGTTLIAVALHEEGLYWISVGDSAIYLHRNGTLTILTTSHIYAHILDQRVERGEITVEQARSDPQREALTSYVGSSEIALIDRNVRPFALQAGDLIVLASDGLFKTLPETEIANTLRDYGQQAAEELVRKTLATQREHQDNVTVCLVRIEDGAHTSSKPPIVSASTVTWSPNDLQDAPTAESPLAGTIAPAQPPAAAARVAKPRTSSARLAGLLVACVLIAIAGCYVVWRLMAPAETGGSETAPRPAQGSTQRSGEVDPASVEPVLKTDPNAPAQPQTPVQVGNPGDPALPPAPPPPPPLPTMEPGEQPAAKQEAKPAQRRRTNKKTTGQK